MSTDDTLLHHLRAKLDGRIMRPLRRQRCRISVRLAPRDLAYRYLRRFAGGCWYRGGNHVARLGYGPGIGFLGFVNDQAMKVKAITMNTEPLIERRAV
jgi:hypothetical protein